MEDANNSPKITQKYVAILALIIAIGSPGIFYATNYFNKEKERPGRQSSVLEDRDGNIYNLTMLDNKLWMADNLNINVTDSYCYEDIEVNCGQYGRLYTWEAAKGACNILGESWRLPTNDEWRQMTKQYGGVRDDSEDDGQAAYKALLSGGNSEFNAILGGGRDSDGKYARLDAHGFYWSATEHDISSAWFYNFGRGALLLNRHNDGDKSMACSVRCIKDIEILEENKR